MLFARRREDQEVVGHGGVGRLRHLVVLGVGVVAEVGGTAHRAARLAQHLEAFAVDPRVRGERVGHVEQHHLRDGGRRAPRVPKARAAPRAIPRTCQADLRDVRGPDADDSPGRALDRGKAGRLRVSVCRRRRLGDGCGQWSGESETEQVAPREAGGTVHGRKSISGGALTHCLTGVAGLVNGGRLALSFGPVAHARAWRPESSMNPARAWMSVATVVVTAGELFAADAAGFDVARFERARVVGAAATCLAESPRTVTASRSPRSAGGPHDFFSEGDYWWPDPKNPGGPYVQRDGMSNPDNFVDHRRALMRLSVQVPDAGRGLAPDRRQALRRPRRAPPARLVRGPGHAHGSAPALRAGHPRHHHRPRPGRHRHPPSRRGGARHRGSRRLPRPLARGTGYRPRVVPRIRRSG